MDITIPISDGLSGTYSVPGDKSISHRALILSSISSGVSKVEDCSTAADPLSTKRCLEMLGVQFEGKASRLRVNGKGIRGLSRPSQTLDAGNSGTTIRLLSGVLVGQSFPSSIAGDSSLNKRPMNRIIDPLRKMGAKIAGTESGTAPLRIEPVPTLQAITYDMPVASAQVKSAILLAGLYADGITTVREQVLTRNHTEKMMGLTSRQENGSWIVSVEGGKKLEPQHYIVPGDTSAAAFLMVAAAIVPNSDILIHNVGLNPTRTALIDVLKSLGANIQIENLQIIGGEEIGDIRVKSCGLQGDLKLQGEIVASVIDEIPILTIAGLFSGGSFLLRDAQELRKKESDRIMAMVSNLRNLGVDVEEYPDGFAFEHTENLKGAAIETYFDHRIAMAFGVLGLQIPGIIIKNAECVDISFPGFWDYLCKRT